MLIPDLPELLDHTTRRVRSKVSLSSPSHGSHALEDSFTPASSSASREVAIMERHVREPFYISRALYQIIACRLPSVHRSSPRGGRRLDFYPFKRRALRNHVRVQSNLSPCPTHPFPPPVDLSVRNTFRGYPDDGIDGQISRVPRCSVASWSYLLCRQGWDQFHFDCHLYRAVSNVPDVES